MRMVHGDIAPGVTIDDNPVDWWCRGCNSRLLMVIDKSSGCVDWGAVGDVDGLDFGCDFGAKDDGSPGHMPTRDIPAVRAYWRQHEARR